MHATPDVLVQHHTHSLASLARLKAISLISMHTPRRPPAMSISPLAPDCRDDLGLDPRLFCVSQEVAHALRTGCPVVALESTIITHGLPFPTNYETAVAAERLIRERGAVPATVAIVQGVVHVGASEEVGRCALARTREVVVTLLLRRCSCGWQSSAKPSTRRALHAALLPPLVPFNNRCRLPGATFAPLSQRRATEAPQ